MSTPDSALRTYRIKQIGERYYIQTLDVKRITPWRWPWQRKATTHEEILIWRVVDSQGNPVTGRDGGDYLGGRVPAAPFTDLQEAAQAIEGFHKSQRVRYFGQEGEPLDWNSWQRPITAEVSRSKTLNDFKQ